jgi:hypothetical protein
MSGNLLYGAVLICPSVESLDSPMFKLTLLTYKIASSFNDVETHRLRRVRIRGTKGPNRPYIIAK